MSFFSWSHSVLYFHISITNSEISKVNVQSVLNLYIFHHFPKHLDWTITFNGVTLKSTQTEPEKIYDFFN